jgi:hypothetical protein
MDNQTQEDYFWTAQAIDGTTLSDGFGNKFSEVMKLNKAGKLEYFILFMPSNKEHNKIVTKIGGKRKLIFFKRRMNHLSKSGKFEWTLTSVGWEENVKGTVIKSLAFIYPNGGIEFNNDEPTLAEAYHQALIKQLDELNQSKVDTMKESNP